MTDYEKARHWARFVTRLWDAPFQVLHYLDTGDPQARRRAYELANKAAAFAEPESAERYAALAARHAADVIPEIAAKESHRYFQLATGK